MLEFVINKTVDFIKIYWEGEKENESTLYIIWW